jgi:malonyl CoA-acyl carrier protein transacylase
VSHISSIHQLFEKQVAKTPEALAVVFGQGQLTYQELDQKANQLAHYLRSEQRYGFSGCQSVKTEFLVGICVERSWEMIVGIMGILKAGATYVPLDPNYPLQRLSYMLEDSGIKILLTQKKLVNKFLEYDNEIICLDTDWQDIEYQKTDKIVNVTPPQNLAYIIYTSGSTGKPKGVMVTHSNLIHSTQARINYYQESLKSYLLLSSFGFDSSVAGIFWTLCVGGKLLLPSSNFQTNPSEIIDLVSQQNVSHLLCLPSFWKLLLTQHNSPKMASLQVVIVAGEVCFQDLVDLHYKTLKNTSLYNEYGPTEATVWSTVYKCKSEESLARVPIGSPIINTQIYILDSHLKPVSVGSIGEIYIGGSGITQGYLNRPELTKEKFILNPFVENKNPAGEFLYKTGDLAKYLPDGNIEFIDRVDNQVKIRGFRLELGEIEAVLSQHPQVNQVATIALTEDSGNKRLVAYIVPKNGIDEEAQKEQVAQWQEVDNAIYSQSNEVCDPTLNLIGWNNSYDGKPIPEEEMRDWVKQTNDRILSQNPHCVLELGCGTGMLLFRIAPVCDLYLGTDISQEALDYIERNLDFTKCDRNQIKLSLREANNLTGIENYSFDGVVINSVTQHFPSGDYLFDVLEQAVNVISDSGFIFVGDIRNRDLLEVFNTSVQLHQADDNLSIEQLRQRIKIRNINEEDLVISPDFFLALQQCLPKISYVEIQLKRGRYHNELSKFRYDVLLHINRNIIIDPDCYWYWEENNLDFQSVKKLIIDNKTKIIEIRNIPNPRLIKEVYLLDLIEDENITNVRELKEKLESIEVKGIEPEDWWNLETEFDAEIIITWSQLKAGYNLIFKPKNIEGETAKPQKNFHNKSYQEYTNNPLHSKIARQLEPKLREYLKSSLPEYMIPTTWVTLEKMPLNANGKIDRKSLPKPEKSRPELKTRLVLATKDIEKRIAEIWQDLLQLEIVGTQDNFYELGGNSLLLIQLNRQLKQTLNLDIPVVKLFQYPTISSLTEYLEQDKSEKSPTPNKYQQEQPSIKTESVAIIGIAGRFPGAKNIKIFWDNLCHGIESIDFFDTTELSSDNPDWLNNPNYVKAGGVLDGIEYFDANFFGYSPKEAEILDPQQRIFLECAWEALEDAGYNPQSYPGCVAVYAGAGMNTYFINNVYPHLNAHNRSFLETMADVQLTMGQEKDFLPTRVSYKLNLTGPSINIQTACSTSLVAVHQAINSLLRGECELALAGGVSIRVPQKTGYIAQKNGIFSPDGHCKAFDADAEGVVFGNGAGIVVLKRLADAIADRDNIYAVIKGSAVNNDGWQKVSYAAPNLEAQASVVFQALEKAGIDPSTIDYIETHGTGTNLGDPIEIAALTQAFRETSQKTGYCAIGSVKTNVGHLANAAGIAGLIKTVLALKYQQIPPSLHFKRPNPHIDFENSPFYVNTQLSPWKTKESPRRAGVSSFGMGGTNVHLVLEEAPLESNEALNERPWQILTLSAKTPAVLRELAQRYLGYLDADRDTPLADICFTANTGRKHFNHRLTVLAESKRHLREQLADFEQLGTSVVKNQNQPSKIAFLFTGQGSQYLGMGYQLYKTQQTFRKTLDRCDEILRPYLKKPLIEVLYPPSVQSFEESTGDELIHETAYTQPALFALEYALFELWKSWGIEPDFVIGHSVGEYVAACVAGVFSLEDGLKLIAERGRLMQTLPQAGKMVALLASEEEIYPVIAPYPQAVSLAAINSPQSVVISGKSEVIEIICDNLEAKEIKIKPLTVSHAFHSPLMEPILADFKRIAQQISFSPPQIPLISNVTGQIATQEVTTADYWCRHIRQPVRFADGMETLQQQNIDVWLEIGPKPILLGMGRQCLPDREGLWLPSLRLPQGDWQQLLSSLAQLYLKGIAVNWLGFDRDYPRRREHLPTYPFERQRHWIEPKKVKGDTPSITTNNHPLLGEQLQLAGTEEIRFSAQISQHLSNLTYLADHRIFDRVILPLTAYLEMALAAGKKAFLDDNITLEEVFIEQPLVLSAGQKELNTLQLVLTPKDTNIYAFEIFSLIAAGEKTQKITWIRHAFGQLLLTKKGKESKADRTKFELAIWQEQCSEQISGETFYQGRRSQYIDFGPSFQGVEKLWKGDGAALGRIRVPEMVWQDTDKYQLHPALLDASLHILGEILPEGTYLPVILDKLQVYHPPSRDLWSYARLIEGKTSESETLKVEVNLFDDGGNLVAWVSGLSLRRAHQTQINRPSDLENHLYEVVWQPTDDISRTQVSESGYWLILADRQGIGENLARSLFEQGYRCTLIVAGSSYQKLVAEQEFIEVYYQINPAEPEQFQQLLKDNPFPWQGVVHLWGIEPMSDYSTVALERSQLLGVGSALHLVQALSEARLSPRLWLVTQGSRPIGSAPLKVQQAPLWGLGQAISLEYPELRCMRLDLDSSDAETASSVKMMLDELLFSDDYEDQIAYRQGIRYVPRLKQFNPQTKITLQLATTPVRVKIDSYGILENLALAPLKRRPPKPEEVEIEVRAAGLNFRDVLNALGMLQKYYEQELGIKNPSDIPLGFECAGEIVAVGENVANFQIGDRVMALATGSLASFVTVPASQVAPKPKNFSFEEAATIPAAFLTAYYALHELAKIQESDRILIHSAAGGVGQAAVQLAQRAGAEVFGTASPAKWDFLKAMGVNHLMNSRTLDFAEEILQLTDKQGVDIVLNSFNKEFIAKSFEVLAQNGRFIELGKIDIWDDRKVQELRPDASYFPFDLGEEYQKNPDLLPSLFAHLLSGFADGSLKPLPMKVFPLENTVDAFRFMAGAKHLGKVVLTMPESASSTSNLVQGEGSYLITGGLGGLGLKAAQWLIEQGAKHLVLASRQGISSPEVGNEVQKLEQNGAEVLVIKADVSQEKDVAHLLAACPQPLRGIIHAAGVLDDGVLQQQSWERFEKVMAPKVAGSWNLHHLTQDLSVDFFICFSSAASITGMLGQGNYIAANTFVDALAHYRQALGLSTLSINWSAWGEVGMAARLSQDQQLRLAAQGIDFITYPDGFQVLGTLMAQNATQVTVLPMTEWSKWLNTFQQVPPFYEYLMPDASSKLESKLSFKLELERIPELARRGVLTSHVRSLVGKTLGLKEPEKIELGQRLFDLGLDSLMAIELRSYLQTSLGCNLRATLLFDYPTLETLVDYLAIAVLGLEKSTPTLTNSHKDYYPTLVTIQPQGTKPPFFCLPGILGNVFELEPLARYLGNEQPFYGLRSLGLDEDTEPHTNMADIAAHHIKAIQEIQPNGPYFLGGHSFGGKVAFEIANQLQDQGEEVSLLAIMDIQVAVVEQEKDAIYWHDSKYIIGLSRIFESSFEQTLDLPSNLNSLSFDEQINLLFLALRKVNLVFSKTELKRLFRVYQANMQAITQYIPQKIFPNKITLLRASEVHPENDFLPNEAMSQKDPTWGWSQLSGQPLEYQIVPGNHFTMMMEPNIQILAQELSAYLHLGEQYA